MNLHGTLDTWLLTDKPGTEDVTLKQTLPDIVRWALRYRKDALYELRLFGDYTRWSTMERQCLVKKGTTCDTSSEGPPEGTNVVSNQERHWKDAYGVRAGGSYWFLPSLEGFLGVGYGSNAVPSSYLEPGLIDGETISFALGGRFTIGEHVGLVLSYTHLQMLKRDVHDSKLDSLEGVSRLPTANGEYQQWFGMLNGLAEFYFD